LKPIALHIDLKGVLSNLLFAIAVLCLYVIPASLSAKEHSNQATPVIITDVTSVSGLGATYGSSSGAISAGFKVSGTDIVGGILVTAPNGFEVSLNKNTFNTSVLVIGAGTVAPTAVYIRFKITAPAGNYTDNIVLSSGPSSVNLPLVSSVIVPAPLNIIGGNRIKVYGETWTDIQNNTFFVRNGLVNGDKIDFVTTHYGLGAAATDSAQRYTGSIVVYGASGGTFNPNNYVITYSPGDIFVVPAKLTLVADDMVRYLGEANPVFTYHGVGFLNSDDLKVITNKPTITTPATATSPIGKYPITLGGFAYAGNYSITFTNATLTIEAERPPSISATGALSKLNTVYGSPSTPTNFTVSGDHLKDGVSITAPSGFEVSTDNVNYKSALKIDGSGNVINPTQVYLRLRADVNIGVHSGNVLLHSGVTNVNIAAGESEVTSMPLIIIANTITKPYGTALSDGPVSTGFTGQGLKNGETIGSVYFAFTGGTAATDGLQTYPNSVTPSGATGGTFTAANYAITYQKGDLIVAPATLTITADNKTRFFEEKDPVFTIRYNGFVNNETEAILSAQPIVNTTAISTSPIGNYPINISGASAANYKIVYVPGVLTVSSKEVLVTNAFTPNGDGINDTWDIQNITQYPNCTVEVFNRYGQKMFYSIGYPQNWSGKSNGAELPVGTYYYIIKLTPSIKPLTGYLAIIR
jgi:gliding motility-associated-like protein